MPNDVSIGKAKIYLLLLVYIIIAYFPASSFLFALKNDALTDNFPPKYFFTAAIHSGEIPLWNPYINFGLPAYADLGFAYWHPVTWLFSLIGYNFYTLTIEVLFFIWLGSIFTYDLGKYLGHNNLTCFIIAIIFGSCGFFIGSLQFINFITCAVFIPLCLKLYLEWQANFNAKTTLKCAIGLYLLITGGHPAIPIGMLYFLVVFAITQLFFGTKQLTLAGLGNIFFQNMVLVIVTSIIALPFLYSAYEIMPWITRNEAIKQELFLDTGFTWPSYLSFIYPFSTYGEHNFWGNSLLMRNGYFSLLGISLLFNLLVLKKTGLQKSLLFTAIFFLLISAGGIFKNAIYSHMPLLQYIRTNGEFRVFFTFACILLIAYPLDLIIVNSKKDTFKRLVKSFLWLSLITSIFAFILTLLAPLLLPTSFHAFTLPAKGKWLLDNTSFGFKLLCNSIIVLLISGVTLIVLKRKSLRFAILFFILADTIIISWMTLPLFSVQTKRVQEMESLLPANRFKISKPSLQPIRNNAYPEINKVIGNWSYYSMQPGTPEYCDYPIIFRSTENYFNSANIKELENRPFVFMDKTLEPITIRNFHNDRMEFACSNSNFDQLILLQNIYPNWEAYENGKRLEINTYKRSFMSIDLKPGSHIINFIYRPKMLKMVVAIWCICLALLYFFCFKRRTIRSSSPSLQHLLPDP